MVWFAIPFLIVTVAIAVFATWHETRSNRIALERRDRLINSRQRMRANELAASYSSEGIDLDIACRVHAIIASVSDFAVSTPELSLDAEQLRAEDGLCDDLGYDLDSLAFCELVTRLEKEFGVRIRSSEMQAPPTVGDIVRLVASQLNEK